MTLKAISNSILLKIIFFVFVLASIVSCSKQRENGIAFDAFEKILSKCIDSGCNINSGSASGRVSGKASFTYDLNKHTIRVKYGYIPLDNYIENLLLENYDWYAETGSLSSMTIEGSCGFKEKSEYYPASIQGLWDSDSAGDGELIIALSRENVLSVNIFGESWHHWEEYYLSSEDAEYVLGVINEARQSVSKLHHKPFYPIGNIPLSFFNDSQWEYDSQAKLAASLGYTFFCKDGRIGLINDESVEIMQPKYTKLELSVDGKYLIAGDEDKVGLITIEGVEIIPAKYTGLELSSDNQYVKVSVDDKVGLITIEGEEVLPTIYSDIMPLSFGVLEKGDEMGYIFVPDDPYVLVYKDDKRGVVDREGNYLCDVKYDQITWYDKLFCKNEDGLDIIDIDINNSIHVDCESSITCDEDYSLIKRDGKWGIIDDMGNILVDTIYDSIPDQGEGDEYSLKSEDGYNIAVIKDGKYGIIDITGQVIVPFEYDEIDNIPYGGYRKLFIGTIDKETWKHEGVWGLYKKGEIIVPCSLSDQSEVEQYIR